LSNFSYDALAALRSMPPLGNFVALAALNCAAKTVCGVRAMMKNRVSVPVSRSTYRNTPHAPHTWAGETGCWQQQRRGLWSPWQWDKGRGEGELCVFVFSI